MMNFLERYRKNPARADYTLFLKFSHTQTARSRTCQQAQWWSLSQRLSAFGRRLVCGYVPIHICVSIVINDGSLLLPFTIYTQTSYTRITANNSVLLWMLRRGPPFVTCNILCASNLIAAATSWPFFMKDLRWGKIRALRWRDWLAIFIASVLRNVAGAYFEVEGLSLTR